ncbi:MAG: hypothetical protein AAGG57_16340 [Pseudomonadota bacterium]
MTEKAISVAAEEAVEDLAETLVQEVFENADRFIRSDDQLNHYAIFRWLVTTQEEQGLVSEATLGTAGSTWLLAQKLGETLQDAVNMIVQLTAVERAMQDMIQVILFANLMHMWRTNDSLQEDSPLGQVLRAEKMQGYE